MPCGFCLCLGVGVVPRFVGLLFWVVVMVVVSVGLLLVCLVRLFCVVGICFCGWWFVAGRGCFVILVFVILMYSVWVGTSVGVCLGFWFGLSAGLSTLVGRLCCLLPVWHLLLFVLTVFWFAFDCGFVWGLV